MNHQTKRLALVSMLLLTSLSLASCRDDHPGRNHPRDRGHDGHRNYDAGQQHR